MTAAQRIAYALAEQLAGVLDAPAMAAHRAFRDAVDAALAVLDEGAVVERVLAQGGLGGARNPHAVVVARLRSIPAHVQDRCEAAVEREAAAAIDGPRSRALRAAAERGGALRAHVRRGAMTLEEALGQLDWECRRDVDALGVALAAFEGGPPLPADANRSNAAPAEVVR